MTRLCRILSPVAAIALLAAPSAARTAGAPTIVLIGGERQGADQGQHDFPNGVIKLERLIKASPDFAKLNPVIRTYPGGFPRDPAEIDDASVVVLYQAPQGENRDGGSLFSPAARGQMDRLAARGVGLVALHQAMTVADAGQAAATQNWLGASRAAGGGWSIEIAPVAVVGEAHPVAKGVGDFDHLDEYYAAIDFRAAGVTPILSARAHVQYQGGAPVYEDARPGVAAWAYERPGGGRSFGFAGGHFLAFLDQPQVRRMVLNAILWSSGNTVPDGGVTAALPEAPAPGVAPPPEPQLIVRAGSEVTVEKTPWGQLEWFAHRSLGNASHLTTGRATIRPGDANPPHWHPNCDEVLYVVQGRIMHRVGDKEYEMRAGDTVMIPEGTIHNARNIGTEDAVLMVSFNSADRVAIGE
ncbi:cupin domain-containing protein [Sphingomonas flavalba]|uniref:cupin domain-containing protein n=1 Tax=Sphingomonas flavalba TaxID=2559804 RepID=UPI001447B0C8|nr:cupin domain-containing protein [Sphingomonas flavalba]